MNRDSWEDEENSSNLLLRSNLRAMGKLGEKMIMCSIFKWWRMHYLFQIKTDVVCNFVKSISWWKRVGFSDAGRVQVLFFFFLSNICLCSCTSQSSASCFTSRNIFMQYCLTCLQFNKAALYFPPHCGFGKSKLSQI